MGMRETCYGFHAPALPPDQSAMTQWHVTLWLACYVAVFAGLSIFGAHRLRILWLYWRHRGHDAPPRARFESLPAVTVQLPLYNEAQVVGQLLDAVGGLDYPKDRLQIQIQIFATAIPSNFALPIIAWSRQRIA